jgi:hypothetical protein
MSAAHRRLQRPYRDLDRLTVPLRATGQQVQGLPQTSGNRIEVPGVEQQCRRTYHQLSGGVELLGRHLFENGHQGRTVAGEDHRSRLDDQTADKRPVLSGHGELQGLEDQAVPGIPNRRPQVQLREHSGGLPDEAMAQHVPRQGVITEPVRSGAEPDDELVDPLQFLEGPLPAGLHRDGVGQLATQMIADAGV